MLSKKGFFREVTVSTDHFVEANRGFSVRKVASINQVDFYAYMSVFTNYRLCYLFFFAISNSARSGRSEKIFNWTSVLCLCACKVFTVI